MPETERPGYERIDLFIPTALFQAVQRAAGKSQSVTAWACAVLAKAAGVEYTPKPVGRPKKARPAPPPKPARKRGKP